MTSTKKMQFEVIFIDRGQIRSIITFETPLAYFSKVRIR